MASLDMSVPVSIDKLVLEEAAHRVRLAEGLAEARQEELLKVAGELAAARAELAALRASPPPAETPAAYPPGYLQVSMQQCPGCKAMFAMTSLHICPGYKFDPATPAETRATPGTDECCYRVGSAVVPHAYVGKGGADFHCVRCGHPMPPIYVAGRQWQPASAPPQVSETTDARRRAIEDELARWEVQAEEYDEASKVEPSNDDQRRTALAKFVSAIALRDCARRIRAALASPETAAAKETT